MNENPEETPNPLNANPESNSNMLDANPAEPLHETANTQESITPDETTVTATEEVASVERESDTEWGAGRESDNERVSNPRQESADEQASIVEESFAMKQKPAAEQQPATEQMPTAGRILTVEEVSAEEQMLENGQPTAEERVMTSEQVIVAAPVESLDPTGRPMEQAVDTSKTPARKKKTGLVFGIIGGILVLAGIVAAVVAAVLIMNKPDPVTMAIQKIMSGEAPKNVAIDGDIDILPTDPDSFIKRVNIDLDSDIVIGSMINTSSAVLTFTDRNDKDYSVKFEEVYAAEGDLFFKIEGAMAAIEDSGIMGLWSAGGNVLNNGSPVTDCVGDASGMTDCATTNDDSATNCVGDASGETNCGVVIETSACSKNESGEIVCTDTALEQSTVNTGLTNTILSVIEAADGVYLRLSSQDVSSFGGSTLDSSPISCITDLISDTNKNSSSAADLYNKYPFITASDKNVIISSKNNPVYRVSLDSKNLTGFINGIQNTEISNQVYNCLGLENNLSVTEGDVAAIINKIPTIYAEVNSDYNFTRLYLESELEGNMATVTMDLGISYPTNVTVTEPVEYTDFKDMIQTIFTTMYDIQSPESTETTESSGAE